ncbi:hypothetical protein JHK86_027746 [Glycine max]|nr:hypothetical protein JHK86_027746 [Glycine max]
MKTDQDRENRQVEWLNNSVKRLFYFFKKKSSKQRSFENTFKKHSISHKADTTSDSHTFSGIFPSISGELFLLQQHVLTTTRTRIGCILVNDCGKLPFNLIVVNHVQEYDGNVHRDYVNSELRLFLPASPIWISRFATNMVSTHNTIRTTNHSPWQTTLVVGPDPLKASSNCNGGQSRFTQGPNDGGRYASHKAMVSGRGAQSTSKQGHDKRWWYSVQIHLRPL